MATTVADLLARAADRDPDGVAVVHAGARVTWSTLDARVTAFARGALARGLRRGDRIALITANRTELIVAHLGALRAGLISVPINPVLTAHELAQRTHDTSPELIICDASSEVAVREALMTNHIGTSGVVAVGSPAWGDLMRPDHPAVEPGCIDSEAVGVLMFTGGIGGRPQAVMLTHRALMASVTQLAALEPAPLEPIDVLLLSLPLVHSQALGALALAFFVGATVVLERRFDPEESFTMVEREGVTAVAGSPALFTDWSMREHAGEVLDDVRLMALGQAAMSPAVAAQLLTLTGLRVWEGYGMAESSGLLTCTGDRLSAEGNVGRPLPGVELRLVDVDGEDIDDDGDPGEIYVRSHALFSGLWPDGASAPDAQGWFATRDVAYLDEAGDLHLVDRRHDLIVVNGFPVYPHEVEVVIDSLDGVSESAVIGVEHPVTGHAVTALVVLDPDSTVTPDDVREQCALRLARHKCPTIVEIVDSLPHTEFGIVQRHGLRSARD
ncbi:MAG: AMP-binding protein [Actinobacteria bacterium]|nr:AMP-binding protein [Actinomycetota bacterium]